MEKNTTKLKYFTFTLRKGSWKRLQRGSKEIINDLDVEIVDILPKFM